MLFAYKILNLVSYQHHRAHIIGRRLFKFVNLEGKQLEYIFKKKIFLLHQIVQFSQMKFVLVLLLNGSLLVASNQLKPWPKYCAVRHVPLPIFWPHSSPYGDPDAGQVDSGHSDSADGRNWAGNSNNGVQPRFGFQPFYRTPITVTSSVLTAIVTSCIPLCCATTTRSQQRNASGNPLH